MTKIDENGAESDLPHLVGSDVGFTEEQHEIRLDDAQVTTHLKALRWAQQLIDDFHEQLDNSLRWDSDPGPDLYWDSDGAARWIPGEGWQ